MRGGGLSAAAMAALVGLVLVLVPGSGPARAEIVTAGLSDTRVEIQSNFVGTELTLFGLIEAEPGAELAETYDVAVVVRGPGEDTVTRRRERIAGIWINRRAVGFADAPSYYAVLSNRPLAEIADPETLAEYQIGLGNIRLEAEGADSPAQAEAFRRAMIDRKADRGLYVAAERGVDMMAPALFATHIPLPAYIRTGAYSARILVFSQGTLVATQRETFWVAKSGFEERVSNWAERRPFLYGLGAVAIAIFAGWFAGVIFRRD